MTEVRMRAEGGIFKTSPFLLLVSPFIVPSILGPRSAIGSDKPSKSNCDDDDNNNRTYKEKSDKYDTDVKDD